MNYYTLRYIIQGLTLILIAVIYKFYLKNKCKKIKFIHITIVFMLGLYIFLHMIPIEKPFIKFDSLESAFKYNFPDDKLYKKFIYDDYAFVLCTYGVQRKFTGFINYQKKDNKWLIVDSFNANDNQNVKKTIGIYTVYINKIDENKIGICIIYRKKENEPVIITDSISSQFETINLNSYFSGTTVYAHVAIIQRNINNDYILNIDNKEYKILE